MKKTVILLTVLLLAVAVILTSCTKEKEVEKGMVELLLSEDGNPVSVLSGGNPVGSGKGGFAITDLETGRTVTAAYSEISEKNGKTVLKGENQELSVGYELVLDFSNGFVKVGGSVRDLSGKDRRLEIRYSLPVDPAGSVVATLDGDPLPSNGVSVAKQAYQSAYPMVAYKNGDVGLAVSTLFDSPVFYDYRYENNCLASVWYIGLSTETKKPSECSFGCLFYDYAGSDGYRGALAKLYRIFPEYFESSLEEHGNWIFQQANIYGMTAFEDFLPQYNETPSYAEDAKAGVQSFIYTAPCELWIRWTENESKTIPSQKILREHLNEMLNEKQPSMYSPLYSDEVAKAIIASKVSLVNGGDFTAGWNASYPNMVCYVTDGDPDIDGGTYYINKKLIENAISEAKTQKGKLGGIYIDNTNFNIGTFDYNKSHFAASDFGILWDYGGSAALPLGYTLWENAFAMRNFADSNGLAVLGNIAFPENNATKFASLLDIPGGEIGNSWGDTETDFMLRRVNAGRKPWTLLLTQNFADVFTDITDKTEADIGAREKLMQKALYWGVMLNPITVGNPTTAKFDLVRDICTKYLWTVKNISEAGWQPVTNAKGSSEEITCERYGNGDAVWFTVCNHSSEKGKIEIDLSRLSIGTDLVAVDTVNNKSLKVTVNGDTATVEPDVTDGGVTAFVIGSRRAVVKALEKEVKTAINRIGKAVTDWKNYADKRLDDASSAIAELNAIEKLVKKAEKLVTADKLPELAETLGEIAERSENYSKKYSTGKINGEDINNTMTNTAKRCFEKIKEI